MNIYFRDIAAKVQETRIQSAFSANDVVRDRKDISIPAPVTVDLTVRAEGEGQIGVHGQLTARLELVCSRCLTSFTETYVIPFNEQFKLTVSTDLSPEEEEDDVTQVTEDLIDLQPYVEVVLLLALPFAPLCSEACKGLCPTCGTNRNEQSCGCSNERIDPRLAGLQDFFKK
ncbi:YceD family protein [Paenibacillus popilliae]|uniref:Predicted metal-binding, possibly nucleic acid-binding protein n=1 Tax=Paenibacillus popilliae ATCC 14706 TaxID=1212764 RepID=M9LLZ8_PAEPP|nr:DUF177 domain-containing protein [Paenibacillus popilliae]GAC44360.1 predicted metal-binding, possibly nucleic acid-binding protein [Paenibacillus popilliae ATCC 14706]